MLTKFSPGDVADYRTFRAWRCHRRGTPARGDRYLGSTMNSLHREEVDYDLRGASYKKQA